MNNLVMYDRETDSLWSQFLGEAISGPLKGTKLELVPSQITTSGNWLEENPDTLYLDTGPFITGRFGFPGDPYARYYGDNEAGVLGESNLDTRLHKKELVVGVVGEETVRGYAERHLQLQGALNDTLDGREILVTMDGESAVVAVFDRTLDGAVLLFEAAQELDLMTDRQTGSTWDRVSGRAVSGQLVGSQMERVPFVESFWFAWTDFYPRTELYEPPPRS